MEAKLIKTVDGYELFTQGFLKGSTNHGLIDSLNIEEGSIRYKLSLKNCQVIELGYDLDALAKNYLLNKWLPNTNQEDRELWYLTNDWSKGVVTIIKNFHIELMGDKKFSEKQLKQSLWDLGDVLFNNCQNGIAEEEPQKYIDIIIQSLQQTEWDVEIEMEDVFVHSPSLSPNQKSQWEKKPKLDADGCLILKRV